MKRLFPFELTLLSVIFQSLASSTSLVLEMKLSAKVFLVGTEFSMGSTEDQVREAIDMCKSELAEENCRDQLFSNELESHQVVLSSYWMSRFEITVAEYKRCIETANCEPAQYPKGAQSLWRNDFPVVYVTWKDANQYCRWTGGRLPTEAEWESAAKGRRDRKFPWGKVYNPFLSNHGRSGLERQDEMDGFYEMAPVGQFPNGQSVDGIFDLAGNVEEWVNDFYSVEYKQTKQINPMGPDSGVARVVRGGSYLHGMAWLRSSSRSAVFPSEVSSWRGFRCVWH